MTPMTTRGTPVQGERPPDDGRVAAKAAPPETVAQHHDAVVPGLVLVGQERPAEGGADAEHVEEVDRRIDAGETCGLARARQAERRAAVDRGQAVERAAHVAHVAVLGSRERLAALGPDDDEMPRIPERQGLEEDRVDDREHGGVGADADRDRREHRGRQRRPGRHEADGLSQIVPGEAPPPEPLAQPQRVDARAAEPPDAARPTRESATAPRTADARRTRARRPTPAASRRAARRARAWRGRPAAGGTRPEGLPRRSRRVARACQLRARARPILAAECAETLAGVGEDARAGGGHGVVAPWRPFLLVREAGVLPGGVHEAGVLEPAERRVDRAARQAGGVDDVEAVAATAGDGVEHGDGGEAKGFGHGV